MAVIFWPTSASISTVPRVSDHFAAWAKQGWSLGNLTSVHINVEVGGGSGRVKFPTANVTTSQ